MSKDIKSFFWASYADLMTSLFFIMLLLFILTTVMLKKKADQMTEQADDMKKIANASQAQLKKITEIEQAINKIDPHYFKYDENHKKHILKIDVTFETGSSDIGNIPQTTLNDLVKAGISIREFIHDAYRNYGVKYLLIVEGQASKDFYSRNYELSFERALSLVRFWNNNGVTFDPDMSEVIISGSGQSGALRVQPDNAANRANQRFQIHIVPKPGIIKY